MLREHLKTLQQLIDNRKAARADRLNIEVRIAQLDHRLVRQRGELELQQRLLASLMGIEAIPQQGFDVQGELELPTRYRSPSGVMGAALASRPDLSEADLQIRAQTERVEAARAQYWPVVQAKGTFGARLSVEGDYDDLGFAGVELSLPVFPDSAPPRRSTRREPNCARCRRTSGR